MSETRDYKVEYQANHPPHIQLSEGDIITDINFSPASKFRHSTLHVKFLRNGIETEGVWAWCEMPRELAIKCSLLMNVKDDLALFLKKMSGVPVEDDKSWRCE